MTDQRNGHYMHTSTGKKYWPMDPRPAEVETEVIAHHLATRCRYNGAVQHPDVPNRMFYSVAEHSVYVAMMVARWGGNTAEVGCALFHDASEAFNGDLIRPLKYDPMFSEPFKHVEEVNERVVSEALSLPYPFPHIVKRADEAVTAAELRQIVPHDPNVEFNSKLHDDSVVAPIKVAMMDPFDAKHFFLVAAKCWDGGLIEAFQEDGALYHINGASAAGILAA
ncbi:MAG: hypothetical protein JJ979_25075 [Roseibium sp.]|nr:hypothetical protein [Roseibium sp.]